MYHYKNFKIHKIPHEPVKFNIMEQVGMKIYNRLNKGWKFHQQQTGILLDLKCSLEESISLVLVKSKIASTSNINIVILR